MSGIENPDLKYFHTTWYVCLELEIWRSTTVRDCTTVKYSIVSAGIISLKPFLDLHSTGWHIMSMKVAAISPKGKRDPRRERNETTITLNFDTEVSLYINY